MNNFKDKNYYEILNVSKNATKNEIKKSYFSLAKKYHPDVCKEKDAEEIFKKISEAYQCLSDENSRKKYDDFLKNPNSNSTSTNFSNHDNYDYFDVFVLDPYFSDSFNKKKFISFLESFDFQKILYLYEYFWLTFWSGSYKSQLMLENKNVSKIFEAFSEKLSYNFDLKGNKKIFDDYDKSLEKIIFEITKNTNDNNKNQGLFNYIANIINGNNIFDNPLASICALKTKTKTMNLFSLFEKIYNDNATEETKNISMNLNKIFTGKSKNTSISYLILGIFILTLIIIFIFF